MNKILILFFVFMIGSLSPSIGQKSTYGISAGVGNGVIMRQSLDGGPSYDLRTGISIGLQYSRKLTNRLHLMTGLNFYNNSVSVTPAFHPDIDMTPINYDLQLIYIPMLLKVDLSKYFFINGGVLGDIDITRDKYITSQSGLGAGFGIGVEIPIGEKFAIQTNPYLNFHGLLLAKSNTYSERIVDAGIKLNLIVKR